MEILPCVRAIDPYFIDLRCVLTEIFDVAKDMAETVLADEVAQISAQAHEGDSGFVGPPALDREAFEKDEALAIEELRADGVEVGGHGGEGERGFGDASEGGAGGFEGVGGGAKLGEFGGGEVVSPAFWVGGVVGWLPDCGAGELGGKGGEGF